MDFLQLSGLSKQHKEQYVLKDISFTVHEFSKVVVAGETGSGKSSLFKIIAGLLQPDGGKVLFKNERVLGPDEKLLPGHKHIAYLSQHFELRNNYKVAEELEYTNHLTDEEAYKIYEVCNITHLLQRWTNEVSGGEKQRIALARTLIASPHLLLLDEPFSNLDLAHKSILKTVIENISQELKITCMLITHDPLDSLSWADEIIVLQNGTILQQASPKSIYHQPVNAYTASLFGGYNLLSPSLVETLTGYSQDQEIFVRPEYFAIEQKQDTGVSVNIKKVNFNGSFYDLLVEHADEYFTVRTLSNAFQQHDVAFVSIKPSYLHNLHILKA